MEKLQYFINFVNGLGGLKYCTELSAGTILLNHSEISSSYVSSCGSIGSVLNGLTFRNSRELTWREYLKLFYLLST